MEPITAYFLSLLEIIEKELKLFRAVTIKSLTGFGWVFLGTFLVGMGFVLLVRACFTAISMLLGPALAGLVAAVLSLSGGGVFLWIGKRSLK